MYEVKPTSRFRRDLKSIERRGYDMRLIATVIQTLASGEPLAEKHKDHALGGFSRGYILNRGYQVRQTAD